MSAHSAEGVVAILVRRGVVTTDLAEANQCCGWDRDEDGFCRHRPHHPIYVALIDGTVSE